jgi:hypothetical protein
MKILLITKNVCGIFVEEYPHQRQPFKVQLAQKYKVHIVLS